MPKKSSSTQTLFSITQPWMQSQSLAIWIDGGTKIWVAESSFGRILEVGKVQPIKVVIEEKISNLHDFPLIQVATAVWQSKNLVKLLVVHVCPYVEQQEVWFCRDCEESRPDHEGLISIAGGFGRAPVRAQDLYFWLLSKCPHCYTLFRSERQSNSMKTLLADDSVYKR